MERKCGVLLPVASLPSKYGIGCFSREAYEFVDFLARAGQTYWQILPLGQTGYGDSPYQSISTFAGNPYFIDPAALIEAGYISESDVESYDFGRESRSVDYEKNIPEPLCPSEKGIHEQSFLQSSRRKVERPAVRCGQKSVRRLSLGQRRLASGFRSVLCCEGIF